MSLCGGPEVNAQQPQEGRHPIRFLISVLASGSGGNATFVSDGTVNLLIDAGLAYKEMERRLASIGVAASAVDAILLSHEHVDHVRGAPVFARKHLVPLYATEGTYRRLKKSLHQKAEWLQMKPSQSIKFRRMTVEVFATPHDAAESVGFRFRRDRLAFTHVTDIGHVSRPVEEGLEGSQAILVESNHDVEMLRQGPYPESLKHRVGGLRGHLSNDALARYLESRLPESVRHIFLGHLSRTNNLESLALASARSALERRGGALPDVSLSYQDRPTGPLQLAEPRRSVEDENQGTFAF